MPITKGQGNPDWTREETLLVLDLLYRHDKRTLNKNHADIVELSRLLRAASFHPADKRLENFRNPEGVAFKLQNLLSAMGLQESISSSKTDRSVVADFPDNRVKELAKIALTLRASIERGKARAINQDEEEAFIEGRYLTSRHRQRDSRLRQRLLAKLHGQPLKCEICDFSPRPYLERSEQESFFEAHHRVPLADAEEERSTKVADMALLCAGCHRFIHRLISKRGKWVATKDVRSILAVSSETGSAE